MRKQEQPGPMAIGRVLHRMMEGWFTQKPVLFGHVWMDEIGAELPDSERLYPSNVEQVFKHWCEAQAAQGRQVELRETEMMLQAPLGMINGEEVIFYGTIDALIDWTGGTWLLEHKTTGNMDSSWENQWKFSAQLQGYLWLLQQNGYQVRGAFVNGLEVRKLPPWDGNFQKKCGTHKVKYSECQGLHVKHTWVGPLLFSIARVQQWYHDARMMAARLLQLREYVGNGSAAMPMVKMDGQFTWPGCSRCSYQAWCEAGRPLLGIEQMMVREEWRGPGLVEDLEEEEA